jgi:hypothetical protein
MPMMIAMVITSAIAGQVISRTNRYKWQSVAGTALITVGIFLMSRLTVESSFWEVSRDMVLVGLGMGMSMPVFGVAAQNAAPYRLLGVVTAASQFFRQIGGTIGVAVLGAMMTASLISEVERTLPTDVRAQASPDLIALAQDAQTMLNPGQLARLRAGFDALGPNGAALYDAALETMRVALAHALADVFLLAAAIMLLAVLAAFFLPEVPLRTAIAAEGEAPARAQPTAAGTANPSRRGMA